MHGRAAAGFLAVPMSSLEYCYWQAFNTLEPLDDRERADYHAALIAQTLVNLKSREPMKLHDFLLFRGPRELDDDEVEEQLLLMFPQPETRH